MPGPKHRLRAITLTLPDNERPSLVLNGKAYPLRNLSQDGIGVWVPPPAPFGLTKGAKVSGDIVIGSQVHPVQVEVAHQDQNRVGLRIVHKSVELAEIFRRLLEPLTYASQLVAHPRSMSVDATVGFPRLWYRTRGTELLVWYHPENRTILGLQLRWLGQWVFRERLHAVQTGYLGEFEQPDHGARVKASELIIHHKSCDGSLFQRAGQFLVAVPKPLPGFLLWQFLETGKPLELPPSILDELKRAA